MSKWIDVPAHRMLEVLRREFVIEFPWLNEKGETCGEAEVAYMIRRIKDGKLFRIARFMSSAFFQEMKVYLEE